MTTSVVPSLAVSEAKDSTLKIPHAIIIDLNDFPLGVIYGHDSDEAEALAEQFARAVNSHFALVGLVRQAIADFEAIRKGEIEPLPLRRFSRRTRATIYAVRWLPCQLPLLGESPDAGRSQTVCACAFN